MLDILVEDGGIAHLECGDVRLVVAFGFGRFDILFSDEQLAYGNHSENNAHNSQRIGDGTTQGGARCRLAQLLQRLLGGTQGGRVGRGSAEDTHHIAHRNGTELADEDGHQCAQQDDTEAQHIQLDTSLAEGTEEAGAYLQAKFIDK